MSEHHRDLAEIALQHAIEAIPHNYDIQTPVVLAIKTACESLEKRFADALGTDERGEDLIEIARNAHRTEMKLAAIEKALK